MKEHETIFGRAVLADEVVLVHLGGMDPEAAGINRQIREALARCQLVGWRAVHIQNDPHGPTVVFMHPTLGPHGNAHVGVNYPQYSNPRLTHRGNKTAGIPWDLRCHTYQKVRGVVHVRGLPAFYPPEQHPWSQAEVRLHVAQYRTEAHIEAGKRVLGHRKPRLDGPVRVVVGRRAVIPGFSSIHDYLRRHDAFLVDAEGCGVSEISEAVVEEEEEVQ